jgi:hypothetical protein
MTVSVDSGGVAMSDSGLFIEDLPQTVTCRPAGREASQEEGDDDVTTLAVGEEGDDVPTTAAVGEEGDDDDVTTLAVGEEGDDVPTTAAVGEEGDDG